MAVLKFTNRVGIPAIENESVSLTTLGETFSFAKHPYTEMYFQGGLWIKINNTPESPTPAVPVYFKTGNGDSVPVHNFAGTAFTTATFPGDGIYLGFYDADTNKLRLLNGYR